MSRRFIGALTALALTGGLAVAPSAPRAIAADTGSRFTLGVMPDTQFYSRYSTPETGNLAKDRYGSEPFASQTKWLADNYAELNMEFATHLGDVVDQAPVAGEWKVADAALRTLDESGLNYSILPGNHDMTSDPGSHPFNEWFPASRAKAANDTFGGRYTAHNADSEYHIFEAEGQRYLVLALAWRAGTEVIDWAQQVIDAHPDLPVILTSHEILNIDGAGEVYYSQDYGASLWESFIKKNDQIFLTFSGHHHGAGYRVDRNDAGNEVISILQDYQMAYQGGNGLLGVVEFDLTGNELEMVALSPWVAAKPAAELTQFDQLILDGPGDSYRVGLNFQDRFAGFAPDWKAGTPDEADLAGVARSIVSEGYVPYTIADSQLPQGPEDFVPAKDTVFHWRPGQATDKDGRRLAEGEAAGAGAIIPEVFSAESGPAAGDLIREAGSLGERITYSTEHHPLSSDEGSLFWADPAGKPATAEFKTTPGAAINDVDTTSGYTFETFVKLPADFNGSDHGWGNALSRDSNISKLVEGSGDTDPTVMFGVSNLRELRWWAEPKEGSGSTVWSHEVPIDEWMHVAVVNNPATDTVEMFINGAPILRNAAGAEGLLPRNLRWVMGAGMSDSRPDDPWYGWIGETRLTHGVLEPNQWLTARSHDTGDAADPGQSSESGSAASSDGSATGSSRGGIIAAVLAVAGLAGIIFAGFPHLQRLLAQLGVKFPQLPRL